MMARFQSSFKTSSIFRGIIVLVFGVLACILYYYYYYYYNHQGSDCRYSFGVYKGHQYRTTSMTIGQPKCWIESKWMRVQQHAVQLTSTSSVIPDWLWIDYHDRINVLVEAPSSSSSNNNNNKNQDGRQFYILEQTKYALEGRTSKAIIGGIIEPSEEPPVAAQREVEEEMHVTCQEFHFLGRFRTDVNRGMGWVHSFLATTCTHKANSSSSSSSGSSNKQGEDEEKDVVGVADVERQDLKTISLEELREAARNGEFLEVQWSNTVALALLHPELMNSR